MTPKEKAKELFDKFDNYPLTYEWKKQCAIIAVDELITDNELNEEIVQAGLGKQYWQEVKQEIEKL